MDEIEKRRAEKLELLGIVGRDNLALAVAQNIAINGRLFCSLIFLLCVAAFLKLGSPIFAVIAVMAIAPIGVACIGDQMREGDRRNAVAATAYGLAALAAISFVFAVLIG